MFGAFKKRRYDSLSAEEKAALSDEEQHLWQQWDTLKYGAHSLYSTPLAWLPFTFFCPEHGLLRSPLPFLIELFLSLLSIPFTGVSCTNLH